MLKSVIRPDQRQKALEPQAMELERSATFSSTVKEPPQSSTSFVQVVAESQTREDQFQRSYGGSSRVIDRIPDLSNTLVKSHVDKRIRAKMVDWIFEVLNHLQRPSFSFATYFRVIQILDLYVKFCDGYVHNHQIHLIGLTCIYVASKYEDMYPITILDLCEKAAHGKFSPKMIRQSEGNVLVTLKYSISYTSVVETLDYHFAKIGQRLRPDLAEDIKNLSIVYLALCQHETNFNNLPQTVFVMSCLVVAVKSLASVNPDLAATNREISEADTFLCSEKSIISLFIGMIDRSLKDALIKAISDVRGFIATFQYSYPDCDKILRCFNINQFFND